MAERKYDAFISHCGSDCKRDFAIILKAELERSGVRSFLDDKDLRPGDNAPVTMLHAMETATFGLVIITEGFFHRDWCLRELQTFLTRGNCIPIFLNKSMERKHAIMEVCEARRAWEKCGFTQEVYFGLIRGVFDITRVRQEAQDGYWHACIAEVKSVLLDNLGKLNGGVRLQGPEILVGIERHVEAVKVLMGMRERQGLAQEVGIVAVRGMGGLGKTTLAQQIYNDSEVRQLFGGRICWLVVGREPSEAKVCQLQKQILLDLCNIEKEIIVNADVGRAEIRQRLQGAGVLICLDDVWADGHTPVICKDDLAPGSVILKTTRDAKSIELGGRQYVLDLLSDDDAKELLLRKAFQGHEPQDEHLALVDQSLFLCARLPLALHVVGAAIQKCWKVKVALSSGRPFWEQLGTTQWETLLTASVS